jgi:hypothetical protein
MAVIAGLMLASGAWAVETAKPAPAAAADPVAAAERARQARMATDIRLHELEARARQLYPRRRDTPLRYLNITDNEVREIQSITRKFRMPELVNISPVVEGCACEEGAGCTEQVFVVGNINGKAYGLQLSRSKNRWGVGTVQRWWLEYAALGAREHIMDYREYQNARSQLLLALPQCAPSDADSKPPQIAETNARK